MRMNGSIAELTASLGAKAALLKELQVLSQQEQSCLVALDLEALDENQQKLEEAMERMERLTERCRGLISSIASELGLPGTATLSPIVSRTGPPQQRALREAQARVIAESKALNDAVALNRGLLEDSLDVVQRSVDFFNRLFNPGDTYGLAGSLVARRGGSRFVCKEV
jgi:hypothetical protein